MEFHLERAEKMTRNELREFISQIEEYLKKGNVVEVPIEHYFSFGVYGREMTLKAGTLLVGKIHKFQNLNILSKGEVSVLSIDGIKRVQAPHTFVSRPGAKRVIYAHTDVVWTTILGSNEKDPEAIEGKFIAKSYNEVDELDAKEAQCLLSPSPP